MENIVAYNIITSMHICKLGNGLQEYIKELLSQEFISLIAVHFISFVPILFPDLFQSIPLIFTECNCLRIESG